MNKQAWIIVLVIVGALVALDIAGRQSGDPLTREIMNTQSELLRTQKSIEQKIQSGGGGDLSEVLRKQQDLDRRLNDLEAKLKPILTAFEGAQRQQQQQPPSEEYTKVYDIEVAHSPIKGNKDAPVTIVEFVDFQCPFCQRFHPAITQAAEAYPGKVKHMLKNFPLSFHPQARPASKAAFAAGEQGKYWEMVELLLANNRELTDDKFKEHAKSLGLNVDRFMKDYKDKDAEWEKRIEADMALGGKIDVRGTPTFFINGKKTMARDLDAFKREIDAILQGKGQ